jgi:pimeloyl-ACP methyl ester carboxylesterase
MGLRHIFERRRTSGAATWWPPSLERPPSSPTLLIWGDADPIGTPEVGRGAAEAIPDARLEVLPAGHSPWLAQPDRTAELVSEFVR